MAGVAAVVGGVVASEVASEVGGVVGVSTCAAGAAAGAPATGPRGRIPVTVVGGFLGAGKTTLLNRWLTQAPEGLRIAVLVNDFGAVNIDAALVERRGADSIALSNGCVCCSLGDDLSAALLQVLDAAPRFDAVVVEASGVADPWRIAQYALVDPQLSLAGVVVLVDAAAALAQAADPRLTSSLVQPLRHADLVLLNKADQADGATLAAARAWAAAHAPAAPVLTTTRADVPLALWLDSPGHQARGGWPHLPGSAWPGTVAAHPADRAATRAPEATPAHDQRFAHWTAPAQALAGQRFDEARLRAWLNHLPPGVLRLKGLLRSASRPWVELQYAGRHASLKAASPGLAAVAEAGPGAAVVAIGLAADLPCEALARGLADCVTAAAQS